LVPGGPVRVTYGQPIDLCAYRQLAVDRQILEEVTGLLMQGIASLKGGRRDTR
jgi:hypothetical protein